MKLQILGQILSCYKLVAARSLFDFMCAKFELQEKFLQSNYKLVKNEVQSRTQVEFTPSPSNSFRH